ncbi:MAG: DUF1501 domain-containing protein [Planctomycetes bacterium]|nr:DUF1501 domain-containing protein [Planctomycetota bacterium]
MPCSCHRDSFPDPSLEPRRGAPRGLHDPCGQRGIPDLPIEPHCGAPGPLHESCTRRSFLNLSLKGTLSLWLAGGIRARSEETDPKARMRSCILLWMDGGASHIDSFDPKPGRDEGGPFQAIRTAVSGLRVCEHLPNLAKEAREIAVIRSVTSPIADHGLANYLMHTGYPPEESVEHPAMGSMLAHLVQEESAELPPYVFLGDVYGDANSSRFGGGFLGDRFAPFTLGSGGQVPVTLSFPEGVDDAEFRQRIRWLSGYEKRFGRRLGDLSEVQQELQAQATRYLSGRFLETLNLDKESEALRDAYGMLEGERDSFGQACLLARRLVEQGVQFVEVSLPGWDTHEENFRDHEALLHRVDAAFSTLLRDLRARGLLESTLVIWMGEFGRTPEINENRGRDHHSTAFSIALAGGGIRGAQVVGKTDERGGEVADRPVSVADLFATFFTLAGLDLKQELYTPEGRPVRIVDKTGEAMSELI